MLILALDTSGRTASCALCRDGEIIEYAARDSMLDHSSTLLPLCEELLARHGLQAAAVDAFAAVRGPGSFTGIRIGAAAVKGLAFSLARPCAGISSMEAAAWSMDGSGRVCARVTARADEYYWAMFEKDGGVRRLTEDAVGSEAEIAAAMAAHGCTQVITDGQNARGAALAAYELSKNGILINCHELVPSYLRQSQAERMKKEKENMK
jgi:tRNA threonylcarbamoyladenosine biosynthesis protein TsaB